MRNMDKLQTKISKMREAIDDIKLDIKSMRSQREINTNKHLSLTSTNPINNKDKFNIDITNQLTSRYDKPLNKLPKSNFNQFKTNCPTKRESQIKTIQAYSSIKTNQPCLINQSGRKYNFNYPLDSLTHINHKQKSDKKKEKDEKDIDENGEEEEGEEANNQPRLKKRRLRNSNHIAANENLKRAYTDYKINSPRLLPSKELNQYIDEYSKDNKDIEKDTKKASIISNNKANHNKSNSNNKASNSHVNFHLSSSRHYSNSHKDINTNTNGSITSNAKHKGDIQYKDMLNEIINISNKYSIAKHKKVSYDNVIENYKREMKEIKLKNEFLNKMCKLYNAKTGIDIANENDYIIRLWRWVKALSYSNHDHYNYERDKDRDNNDSEYRGIREDYSDEAHEVNKKDKDNQRDYKVICEKIMKEYNMKDTTELSMFIDLLLKRVSNNDCFLEGIKKILLHEYKLND